MFLELGKVEELAEENVVEFDWLVRLLIELIEATFDWISRNHEIWMTNKEDTTVDESDRLTQVKDSVSTYKSVFKHDFINFCFDNSLRLTCNLWLKSQGVEDT